jgi:hypothetical protein
MLRSTGSQSKDGSRIALPRTKVTEVLGELHEGSSGEPMKINKTLAMIREWYYWLHTRCDTKRWHQLCDTYAAS